MAHSLTIVMYHFVRGLAQSRFPTLKGLELEHFRNQVDYLQATHSVVRMEQVIEALDGGRPLPDCAALLTFDDGYLDHFINVFPILNDRKIQGAFFAPVRAVREHALLDVNRIHFILASADAMEVTSALLRCVGEYRSEYGLRSPEDYFETYAKPGRYDSREVMFVKRLLQVELPEVLRARIADELFEKYVGVDPQVFARELYMTEDQLTCMLRSGMHIGSHGHDHIWLDACSPERQRFEVDSSKEFLRDLGADPAALTMCYPKGVYNASLVEIIRQRGFKLGLTIRPAVADLTQDDRFELPRLDTNDLPKGETASVDAGPFGPAVMREHGSPLASAAG